MPRNPSGLTLRSLAKVQPGQSVFSNGLEFKRLNNGDGAFYAKKMVNGKTIRRLLGRESEGYTLPKAKEDLAALTVESREGRLKSSRELKRTFAVAAAEYLKRQEEANAPNLTAKRQHLDQHLIPFFGEILLAQLCPLDAERYRKKRTGEYGARRKDEKIPISQATINRELQTLRHLLGKAEEWGWLSRAPRIRLKKEDNRRTVFLETDEIQALYQAAMADAHPFIYPFVRIALETGMRRGEILSLKAEYIHFPTGTIFLPKAKKGSRTVHMTPSLTEYLKGYLESRNLTSGFLFPAESESGHCIEIRKPFFRVLEAAGITREGVTIHVLRHTFATHLAAQGADPFTIAALTGHSSLEMVHRYTHASNQRCKDAIERLGSQLTG
jgi:integrase